MKNYNEFNSQNFSLNNRIDIEILVSLLKENDRLKEEINCLKNKIS